MGRKLINPPLLHPAPGYCHITEATGRRMVYFAGQVALDAEFAVIGADDLYQQTVAAMKNLETALRAVGGTWDDVVRRTIYTTRPTEFETISRAISDATNGAADPAQTIAGVAGLALPELLIEIEATASLP